MSIRGELVQALRKAQDERKSPAEAVQAILDAASDPNWAQRFAGEQGDTTPGGALAMSDYWRVIAFLKENA